jgi:AraC-like DNA-binding protein
VESCGGQIQVHKLADLVGTSVRTLERTFLAEVGLSPKRFIRLVRFQNTIGRVRNQNYRTLAELASDCGYADQPHFIREIKQFTGSLPSRI